MSFSPGSNSYGGEPALAPIQTEHLVSVALVPVGVSNQD
jgi:hypothetical protein